ncbi:PH domain-containing protein [Maribellus maritimus]|uniref:PH domain-containing protein n=1 Tax=Maribellus maritimus TaxID=2870838 RepID=UPI001EEC4AFF|nr:PH domain-containing protein [Maribellus maritimus]MCG6190858.1 PH domain-containing protein [Maribellus maritimus]
MIENTTYIKRRPSQLVNVGHFFVFLIFVPLQFIPDKSLAVFIPAGLLPGTLEKYLLGLPVYLLSAAFFLLCYHLLKTRCICYEINPEELQYTSGIFHRKHEYIELYRIKDFQVDRPLLYRFFGLGTLVVYTSDKTTPVFRLEAIRKPEEVYTVLRGLVELNRKEKHVYEID